MLNARPRVKKSGCVLAAAGAAHLLHACRHCAHSRGLREATEGGAATHTHTHTHVHKYACSLSRCGWHDREERMTAPSNGRTRCLRR